MTKNKEKKIIVDNDKQETEIVLEIMNDFMTVSPVYRTKKMLISLINKYYK